MDVGRIIEAHRPIPKELRH